MVKPPDHWAIAIVTVSAEDEVVIPPGVTHVWDTAGNCIPVASPATKKLLLASPARKKQLLREMGITRAEWSFAYSLVGRRVGTVTLTPAEIRAAYCRRPTRLRDCTAAGRDQATVRPRDRARRHRGARRPANAKKASGSDDGPARAYLHADVARVVLPAPDSAGLAACAREWGERLFVQALARFTVNVAEVERPAPPVAADDADLTPNPSDRE